MRARGDAFWRCERGTAAVEFAIIALVLVSLLVAVVDFGRTLYVKNQLSYLADQATRMVLLNPAISDATLETELRALPGLYLDVADTDDPAPLQAADKFPGVSRADKFGWVSHKNVEEQNEYSHFNCKNVTAISRKINHDNIRLGKKPFQTNCIHR